MATLAAKILALNDGKKSTREIAEKIYGAPVEPKHLSYVRVVLRQRRGAGSSENDRRYLDSSLGIAMQRRANRKALHKKLAYLAALRSSGDKEKANDASRRVRKAARMVGKSGIEAKRFANRAYNRMLEKTGNRATAREAYRIAQSQHPSDGTSLQGEMR